MSKDNVFIYTVHIRRKFACTLFMSKTKKNNVCVKKTMYVYVLYMSKGQCTNMYCILYMAKEGSQGARGLTRRTFISFMGALQN